ncbi:manganese efflux pump MntP [Alkalihalobacterium chitinilyticum]|uniref:Putative manganese efflux pump MntP n=1 Tax=Alkalihalobacterium chitinilyticum TaxID=2980103 RepID=A0ABT5VGV7_9BACI|nr:manganese efflux pump MntP family protein [Alkalihalobacterium chitinilyticum]MDE5414686.1 manganese efflux pump MntP family protein [Alkalihalobacterium chitinilyticum]
MATALGMDAFSVALGMGLVGLRYRQMFKIGIVIGGFHIIMPLLGIVTGKLVSNYFGLFATYLGGGLLLFLGLQMSISSLKKDGGRMMKPIGFGLIIFALSVSLDSFSAGLSLGMLGAKTVIAVAAFGLMSMILSWTGLVMGSRFKGIIGSYGELLGGLILMGFGVKLLLP